MVRASSAFFFPKLAAQVESNCLLIFKGALSHDGWAKDGDLIAATTSSFAARATAPSTSCHLEGFLWTQRVGAGEVIFFFSQAWGKILSAVKSTKPFDSLILMLFLTG
jgi:hypothetical protein